MNVEVYQKDTRVHKWHLVARFEYGTHAMECARALSETGGLYKVVDHRWPDEPQQAAILYENGVAS